MFPGKRSALVLQMSWRSSGYKQPCIAARRLLKLHAAHASDVPHSMQMLRSEVNRDEASPTPPPSPPSLLDHMYTPAQGRQVAQAAAAAAAAAALFPADVAPQGGSSWPAYVASERGGFGGGARAAAHEGRLRGPPPGPAHRRSQAGEAGGNRVPADRPAVTAQRGMHVCPSSTAVVAGVAIQRCPAHTHGRGRGGTPVPPHGAHQAGGALGSAGAVAGAAVRQPAHTAHTAHGAGPQRRVAVCGVRQMSRDQSRDVDPAQVPREVWAGRDAAHESNGCGREVSDAVLRSEMITIDDAPLQMRYRVSQRGAHTGTRRPSGAPAAHEIAVSNWHAAIGGMRGAGGTVATGFTDDGRSGIMTEVIHHPMTPTSTTACTDPPHGEKLAHGAPYHALDATDSAAPSLPGPGHAPPDAPGSRGGSSQGHDDHDAVRSRDCNTVDAEAVPTHRASIAGSWHGPVRHVHMPPATATATLTSEMQAVNVGHEGGVTDSVVLLDRESAAGVERACSTGDRVLGEATHDEFATHSWDFDRDVSRLEHISAAQNDGARTEAGCSSKTAVHVPSTVSTGAPRSTAGSARVRRAASTSGSMSLRRAVSLGQDAAAAGRDVKASLRGGQIPSGECARARVHADGPPARRGGGEVILPAGVPEERSGGTGRSSRGALSRRSSVQPRGAASVKGTKACRGPTKKGGKGLSMVATFVGDAEMRARMEGIRKLQDDTVAAESKGHRMRRRR